jgi:hypothetical protein
MEGKGWCYTLVQANISGVEREIERERLNRSWERGRGRNREGKRRKVKT